ncbi:MAG: thioredoxin domain-containing protein [Phycisphaeraceae bacterium]|nr:thioredoxin domain-containing protein [Phycisphaeraceae bacterium]
MSSVHPPSPTADRRPNRLAGESSPYLLQHAHNPVEWFPWGPEAFEEARRRRVPIFLSVGYSTCYWCHVMERESFENPSIGAQMSRDFVCIKVDREERPEVDDIAMHACQALTGRGGWPTSVFLTPPGARAETDPGLEPFWAGTYFPPEPRHGLPSFQQVLGGIANAWNTQREQVLGQSERIADMLRELLGQRTLPVRLGAHEIDSATNALVRMYDRVYGGFGTAGSGPKFPQPVFLEFLLDRFADPVDDATKGAIKAALMHTLDRMTLGGIHDQLAGGFHRYSVDPAWVVPHFEKMLYDNAQLASTYARASEAFGEDADEPDALYARTVRLTLDYALREMQLPGGAFASAQDAEVDGMEGANYLWTPDDLAQTLTSDEASFAAHVYGLDRGPNFKDPHHEHLPPKNVLLLGERPEEIAARFNLTTEQFYARLDQIRWKMLGARAKRTQPLRDDKVIVSWNGLMLSALAHGAMLLRESRYLDAANRAAAFILSAMRNDKGELVRVWRDGRVGTTAVLEDYAMLAQGLIAMHRASTRLNRGTAPQLERALSILDEAFALFACPDTGALFDTRDGRDDLVVRAISRADGAMPSGQSVMLHALLDAHEITRDDKHLERAGRLLAAMSRAVHDTPLGAINSTRALRRVLALDPALLDRFGMTESPERFGPDLDPSEPIAPPVEVFADVDGFHLAEGDMQEFTIELRIREGFHITANQPYDESTTGKRVDGLEGLQVGVTGGRGVILSCDYPAGTPFEPAIAKGTLAPILVHSGTVRLDITALRTTDAWEGEPKVAVRFQACNDRECLQAMTAVLEVGMTRKEA